MAQRGSRGDGDDATRREAGELLGRRSADPHVGEAEKGCAETLFDLAAAAVAGGLVAWAVLRLSPR